MPVASRSTAIVLSLAAFGVTLSTIVDRAQGVMYYAFVLLFLVPLVLPGELKLALRRGPLVAAAVLILLFSMQVIWVHAGVVTIDGVLRQVGLSLVLFLTCWIAAHDEVVQRLFFAITALAHAMLAFVGYLYWSPAADWDRLGTFGLHTAAWAEFALGAILAALCTGDRRLVLVCSALAFPALAGTSMRGAIIGATLALAISFYPIFAKQPFFVRAFGAFAAAVLVIAFSDWLLSAAAGVLLWDDPHRGAEAGFSGRFDNIGAGIAVFLEHAWFGAGTQHPVAAYTHNAFAKVAAEQGVFALLMYLALIAIALIRANHMSKYLAIAVVLGWTFYMLTAPRYVSFSFANFVGWIVIMHYVSAERQSGAPPRGARSDADVRNFARPVFGPERKLW